MFHFNSTASCILQVFDFAQPHVVVPGRLWRPTAGLQAERPRSCEKSTSGHLGANPVHWGPPQVCDDGLFEVVPVSRVSHLVPSPRNLSVGPRRQLEGFSQGRPHSRHCSAPGACFPLAKDTVIKATQILFVAYTVVVCTDCHIYFSYFVSPFLKAWGLNVRAGLRYISNPRLLRCHVIFAADFEPIQHSTPLQEGL